MRSAIRQTKKCRLRTLCDPPAGAYLHTLFSSPEIVPPRQVEYGKEVCEFVVSKIFKFGDKLWQLRSICISGRWFLYPFVFSPLAAGTVWNRPIICDAVIEKHFGKPRSVLAIDEDHSNLLLLPQPLAKITRPLVADWYYGHKEVLRRTYPQYQHDCRFNLLGGTLSQCIICVEFLLRARKHPFKEDTIVNAVMEVFAEYGPTEESVRREIEAYKLGASDKQWKDYSLPFEDNVFVVVECRS